jgi:uncharacterized membrane protein YfcA
VSESRGGFAHGIFVTPNVIRHFGQPPHRANALIHCDIAATTLANVARAYKDGCLVPIEVVAWKR